MQEQDPNRDQVAELFREVARDRAGHRVTHAAHARRQARAADRQQAAERASR
jgi:predicted translin family RNA/ssDNA-binding protein